MKEKRHQFIPNFSVFPVRHNSDSEEFMRQGFIEVACKIIGDIDSYQSSPESLLAGIEIELPLINHDLSPVMQSARDAIVQQVSNTQVELGAHQLEVTPAQPADIKQDVLSLEAGIEAALRIAQTAVRRQNLAWLRIGSYPLCNISEVKFTRGDPKYVKYEVSPRWHIANQRPGLQKFIKTEIGVFDISNAFIVGLMNAIQVTIDAVDMDDALDKLNRSFMVSPMATALGANATHISCFDTDFDDIRFTAWSTSHDTRSDAEAASQVPTRVGLPSCYIHSLASYFNSILAYPFILNDPFSRQHPFEVGNGLYWRDARLKFFRDKQKVGVEFRPVPIQPSLHEDIAMMLFYIGRLLWSQSIREPLLEMKKVWVNNKSAVKFGLDGNLYTFLNGDIKLLPAKDALAIEINRAHEGLAIIGCGQAKRDFYLNTLKDRLQFGNPASLFRAACLATGSGTNKVGSFEEKKDRLIQAIHLRNLVER